MRKEEESIPDRPAILWEIIFPLALLIIITVLCWVWPVDRSISGAFYEDGEGWMLRDNLFFDFVYNEGVQPAIYVVGGSLIVLLVGFHYHSLRRMRKVALYLVLVMVIGPGLLVNAVLKEHWGRPRPRDVTEFGGKERFERVWEYDASSPGKSFPSGHASMGFFFFAAYFLVRRWGKGWARGTLATALILGILLGFTRIVQGGHYFSDVVWSAGVCYFVSVGLFYALRMHRGMMYDAEPKRFAPWQWGVAGVVVLGAGLLTVSIPYHDEKDFRVSAEKVAEIRKPLYVDVELLRGDVRLTVGESFVFESDVEAFGLPGSRVKDSFEVEDQEDRVKVRLKQSLRGFFPVVEQPAEVLTPASAEVTEITSEKGDLVFDATGMRPGSRVKLNMPDGDIRLRLPENLPVRVDMEEGSSPSKPADVRVKDLVWDEKEQRWKRGGGDKAVIEITISGGRLFISPADPAKAG